MAEIFRYINPDVVGGAGDGTTLADAYSSSSACEAAEQTDLVTATDNFVAECYSTSGTADTTQLRVAGWTANPTYDIVWKSSSSDRATTAWDATKYRFEVNDAVYVIELTDDHFTFDGFQVHSTVSGDSDNDCIESQIGLVGLKISNCFCSAADTGGNGIAINNSSAQVQIWNTICMCPHAQGGTSEGIHFYNVDTAEVYNCIVYNFNDGVEIDAFATSVTIKNCAVFGNNDDFDVGGTSPTIDYCASDDGDGTNAVSPSGADWDNEYTDSANGDFSLVPSGNCEGGGTDNPGSGLYSTDINGDAYTSTWSIGVEAKTAAAGGNPWYYNAQQ